ncbi:MAG: HD domain-containing protein [Clostridia bacterium]
MFLHEMLINEEYIKGIYNSIENNPRIPISHGISHIKSVLSYAKVLANLFNINNSDKETLFCSVVLHDIAQVFLQKNHAINSAGMARQILENNESINTDFIKNQLDINRVEAIIRSHGGKSPSDYIDVLARILILADKLDFVKSRLRPRAKEFNNFDFMKEVEVINLKLQDDTLIIEILTNTTTSLDNLNLNHGLDHFLNVLRLFTEHQNVGYQIIVNKI